MLGSTSSLLSACGKKGGVRGTGASSAGGEGEASGRWAVVTAPRASHDSPSLPPRSLGLQPGLRERGDDPGPPAAPRGGAAGADVRTPAHDPVRLPAQPGPRGPPQGALLHLLMAGHGPPRPPRVLPCPVRTPPSLPSCPNVTFCRISHFGLGLSLACPHLAGHPAGPLREQGSIAGGPPPATFRAGS